MRRAGRGGQAGAALGERQRGQPFHFGIEGLEVAALPGIEALELGGQAVVGGQHAEGGIVGALEPAVVAGIAAPGAGFHRGVVGTHGGEQAFLAGAFAGVARRACIERLQQVAVGGGQQAEVFAAALAAGVAGAAGVAAVLAQPALGAEPLDRGGERFVEDGVARREGHLVRQLVEDEAGQLALGIVDEGVEQRVGEPVAGQLAEGGVGGHRIDRDLEALRPQRRGFGLRAGLGVVAAVADAADDGKAPGLELEAQLGRGDHVPDRGRALQVGVAAIAGVVGLAELDDREIAHALGEGQPLLEPGRRRCIGQPLRHWPRGLGEVEMAGHGARVVAEGAATRGGADHGARDQGRGDESADADACHGPAAPPSHAAAVAATAAAGTGAAGSTSTRQS